MTITLSVEVFGLLALAGAIAGILSGLLGLGGGVVIVPTLYFVFSHQGLDQAVALPMAISSSLACIVVTAISSMIAHHRAGNIEWDIIQRWAPFAVFGACSSALLVRWIGGGWLSLVFASLAIFVAFKLWFQPSFQWRNALPSAAVQRIAAYIIASLSTLAGVGGGSLTVPSLVACSYSPTRAVGMSVALGFVIAASAALVLSLPVSQQAIDLSLGLIYWPSVICIVSVSVLTAPLGAWLSKFWRTEPLQRVFAIILLITASRMLYQWLGS